MIRVPVELFWAVVGDIYGRIFKDRARRPMEALWQGTADLTADLLTRSREAIESRAIFSSRHDSHWGNIPLYIEDITDRVQARVLRVGVDVWGRTTVVVLMPPGTTPEAPGSLWDGLAQQLDFFIAERISGDLWVLTSTQDMDAIESASYFFGGERDEERFEAAGSWAMTASPSGLVWDPTAINWAIIVDNQEHPSATGRIEAQHNIELWSTPGMSATKFVAMQLFSDTPIEVRLTQTAGVLQVMCGISFSSLNAMTVELGTIDNLRSRLVAATPSSPVAITLAVDLDLVQGVAVATISADGFRARLSGIPWSSNVYRIIHHAFNGWGDLRGRLVYQSLPESKTYGISRGVGSAWRVTPAISSCAAVAVHPWRLTTKGYVESRVVAAGQVIIDVGQADWLPPRAMVQQDGATARMTLIDLTGSQSSWQLESGELPSLGQVIIEPWVMGPGEFSFEEPGLMRTSLTPSSSMWAREARAQDVNLFERWGDLLGVGRSPDSESYLRILQGVYLALHSSPSPSRVASGAGIMLGLDFARIGGRVLGYETVRNDLGTPEAVLALLDSGESIRVPWALRYRATPVGQDVMAWEPAVDGVRVSDIHSAPDVVEANVPNVWAHPHVFVVEIPGELGLSYDLYQAMWHSIRRARDPHTLPVLAVRADSPGDDGTEGAGGDGARGTTLSDGSFSSIHLHEDMVFDDGQCVVGENPSVNPFDQQPTIDTMDGRQLTSDGSMLSQDSSTGKLVHLRNRVGYRLGDAYPRETTLMRDGFARGVGLDMKADLSGWETGLGLSRSPLRLQPAWTQKPTCVSRVLTDVGGALTYHTQAWVEYTLPGGFTPAAAATDGFNWWIGGTSSTILKSTAYGEGAAAETVPGGLAVTRIHEEGWALCLAPNTLLKRSGSTWTEVVMSGATGAHDYAGVDVKDDGNSVIVCGESVTTPGSGVILRSFNAGSTWAEVEVGGEIVLDVLFDNHGRLWIARDGAIAYSNDYGATWTDVHSGGLWVSLSIAGDRLWCAGGIITGGTRCGYIELNSMTPSFVPKDLSLGELQSRRIVASSPQEASVVLSDGSVAVTRDDGDTWDDQGLTDVVDMAGAGWNMRLCAGTSSDGRVRWI